MIAQNTKKMKDNKSHGVDGIPPNLLQELVEQISTQLAKLFNFSLEEGIGPSEWKETNITPLLLLLLRRDRGTSHRITDQ